MNDHAIRATLVGKMKDITSQLISWADELQAIARNGLIWSPDGYDRERYSRLLDIASTMIAVANARVEVDPKVAANVRELLDELIVDGVRGYATPKSSVAAVVFNTANELLLVQRSDNGSWTLPTGWSDVGLSPAEVAAKEVREETGLAVIPRHLMGVYDTRKHRSLAPFQIYALLFYCEYIGGDLSRHPLETLDVGFFSEETLPSIAPGFLSAVAHAFAFQRGEQKEPFFDYPGDPNENPDLR